MFLLLACCLCAPLKPWKNLHKVWKWVQILEKKDPLLWILPVSSLFWLFVRLTTTYKFISQDCVQFLENKGHTCIWRLEVHVCSWNFKNFQVQLQSNLWLLCPIKKLVYHSSLFFFFNKGKIKKGKVKWWKNW